MDNSIILGFLTKNKVKNGPGICKLRDIMRRKLEIQNGPHISFSCDAIAEEGAGLQNLRLKLCNPSLGPLISGVMECRILESGNILVKGFLRKTGEQNQFVFEF